MIILFLTVWELGPSEYLQNCTGIGANLNLLNTEIVIRKQGGILCNILWDGLVEFVTAFGRWGYWTSEENRGCISWSSLFFIHQPKTGVPCTRWRPVVVVRWRLLLTLRNCDLRYGMDGLWYIFCFREMYIVVFQFAMMVFYSFTWTPRSKRLRLWCHNATYRLTRLSFYYLSNTFYCFMWNPP